MRTGICGYLGLSFPILFLLGAVPVAFLHAQDAQVTELDTPPQQCNKDPTKGKLGPVGDPPPTKCVTGATIQEGKKNSRFFDSLVQVDGLGRTKVCDTPIPLKENCEPAREAIVEYCDDVLKNATGGRSNGCKKIPKSADPKTLDSIDKIIEYLSDKQNRYDYVARGILKSAKDNLDKNPAVLYSSIQDPAGIVIPLDDSEKAAAPYLNNAERRVEGPSDILRSLASDISPTNPTQLDAAKALVEKADTKDRDPWLLAPRYIEDTSLAYQDKFQDRFTLHSTDQGIEVNYYPKDTPTFAGPVLTPKPDEVVPMPKVPLPGDRPLTNLYNISTFDYLPLKDVNHVNADLQPKGWISQSIQAVQNTYAATVSAVQNGWSNLLLWIGSFYYQPWTVGYKYLFLARLNELGVL